MANYKMNIKIVKLNIKYSMIKQIYNQINKKK